MTFFFASLNSGSNGNAYFVGNKEQGLLVDAGLSCRETEKRMDRLGIPMEALKAIFVSHEHSDHITGIPALVKKYGLPVYLSAGTRKSIPLPLPPDTVQLVSHGQQVAIAGMQVTCFSKCHDAAEPLSFVVTKNQVHVGIFTDIGMPCENLRHYARQCHAMLLESNYCEEMLEKGRYTATLKKRIRGKEGHLSNDQALELYLQCSTPQLKHLVLGHLSQNNNTQEKVTATFAPHALHHTLAIASRYKESPLYVMDGCRPVELELQTLPVTPPVQGRLFE